MCYGEEVNMDLLDAAGLRRVRDPAAFSAPGGIWGMVLIVQFGKRARDNGAALCLTLGRDNLPATAFGL